MTYNINITKVQKSRLSEVDFDNIPFGRIFSDHMFVADFIDGQWQNLEIKPFGDLVLSPVNSALHYGQSVFEGMKASKTAQGVPVFLRPEMHAKRLKKSAIRMCMEPVPEDLFLQALHTLVELDADWIPEQRGSALYIRPFMFAMDNFLGVRPSDSYKFMMFTGPVGPYYSKPVTLLAQTDYIRAAIGGVGEAKTAGNYAASLYAVKLAQESGYDQVLWLDGIEKKYIQEVGTMNIFFNFGGTIVTPETDGAILKGITRDIILKYLEHKNIPCEVRKVSIDEVVAMHEEGTLLEIFGSGTAAVIAKVSALTYKDKKMELPTVVENSMADMLKDEIEQLRLGLTDDPFGWVVPVGTGVTMK